MYEQVHDWSRGGVSRFYGFRCTVSFPVAGEARQSQLDFGPIFATEIESKVWAARFPPGSRIPVLYQASDTSWVRFASDPPPSYVTASGALKHAGGRIAGVHGIEVRVVLIPHRGAPRSGLISLADVSASVITNGQRLCPETASLSHVAKNNLLPALLVSVFQPYLSFARCAKDLLTPLYGVVDKYSAIWLNIRRVGRLRWPARSAGWQAWEAAGLWGRHGSEKGKDHDLWWACSHIQQGCDG
jgi:hypothetical protein